MTAIVDSSTGKISQYRVAIKVHKVLSNIQKVFMNSIYHCIQCDKEFLDSDIAGEHYRSTNDEIKKRVIEKSESIF